MSKKTGNHTACFISYPSTYNTGHLVNVKRKLELFIFGTVIIACLIFLFTSDPVSRVPFPPKPSDHTSARSLTNVITSRSLSVLTRNTINTYIIGPDGAEGFEYELARDFATKLGVELDMHIASSFPEIIPAIQEDKYQLAAANLTITDSRKLLVNFSEPYIFVTQQLLYRDGTKKPESIDDIKGSHLIVVKNSSHSENLNLLKQDHPDLVWSESNEDIQTLASLVSHGDADLTIADSMDTAILQRLYPDLRVAFDLTSEQPIAWAFPPGTDSSLLDEANTFLNEYITYGRMERLKQKYFGDQYALDYVSNKELVHDMNTLLPKYKTFFIEAALTYNYNWQLLAAMSYQESHWDKDAISGTGVEGLMMLTKKAAADMEVKDRKDPYTSIIGGTRYLREIQDRLPQSIQGQNRIWVAMAAYNIGIGHIYDARRITQEQGGDPNSWADIKKSLPLLAKPEWHKKTKYGYARGYETVQFIDNIQKYYKIISWLNLT